MCHLKLNLSIFYIFPHKYASMDLEDCKIAFAQSYDVIKVIRESDCMERHFAQNIEVTFTGYSVKIITSIVLPDAILQGFINFCLVCGYKNVFMNEAVHSPKHGFVSLSVIKNVSGIHPTLLYNSWVCENLIIFYEKDDEPKLRFDTIIPLVWNNKVILMATHDTTKLMLKKVGDAYRCGDLIIKNVQLDGMEGHYALYQRSDIELSL